MFRSVKSGYIRIKLDDKNLPRSNHLFDYSFDNKKLKTKHFEQRLCGKRGRGEHDICHLYVSYYHAGYGTNIEECIGIDDIRPNEELDRIYEEDDWSVPAYVGGHCSKLKDNSIVIAFGVNSEQTVNKICINAQ